MKKIITNLLLIFIGSTVNAQFLKDFPPALFPTNSCNNYANNNAFDWKPSHGSPSADNNDRVELKVKDAGYPNFTTLSEGVFIDLSSNGLNIQSGNNYTATFYYQKLTDAYLNITFKSYLVKSSINESSNSKCDQEKVPNVSGTKGIYTSNDYLSLTYSGEVKTVTVNFEADASYKYLWIYSDVLSKFSNDAIGTIYLTQVSVNLNVSNNNCDLNAPSSPHTENITQNSAKLDWSTVSGNDGYEYAYRESGKTLWSTGTTSSSSVNRDNLVSDTTYQWRVRAACSNGLYGDWSSIASFTTLIGCKETLPISSNASSGTTDNQSAKTTIVATNTINTGATAAYDAGTTVSLKAGFNAKSGATFRAFIEGCSTISSKTVELEELEKQTVLKEENILVNNRTSIYPNPTTGLFTIVSNEKIIHYAVFNSLNTVLYSNKVDVNKVAVNIQNLPMGMYIVRFTLASGEIVMKKILKN